jgi:hypothetical protein
MWATSLNIVLKRSLKMNFRVLVLNLDETPTPHTPRVKGFSVATPLLQFLTDLLLGVRARICLAYRQNDFRVLRRYSDAIQVRLTALDGRVKQLDLYRPD